MEDQNNPVRRLHKLLLEVRSNARRQSAPAVDAWMPALRVSDRTEYMRALKDVADLLDACEHAIRQNPQLDTNRYLTLLNNIRLPLLERGFFGTCAELISAINPELLERLEFAADAVPMSENVVADEEIQDLITQVNALMQEIAASELDAELSVYLVNGAKAIHSALVHYEVFGNKGLQSAFFSQLGIIVALRDDIQAPSVKDKCIQLTAKLIGVLSSSETRTALKMLSAADQSMAMLVAEPGIDESA